MASYDRVDGQRRRFLIRTRDSRTNTEEAGFFAPGFRGSEEGQRHQRYRDPARSFVRVSLTVAGTSRPQRRRETGLFIFTRHVLSR